jgi:hypothetical protein
VAFSCLGYFDFLVADSKVAREWLLTSTQPAREIPDLSDFLPDIPPKIRE